MHLDLLKKKCECGCGEQIPAIGRGRKLRRFVHGHSARGKNNPAWKGGRHIHQASGYVLVWVGRDHHLANVNGHAYEHRIVAEARIGRRLRRSEIVHHLNGDPSDNRPENIGVAEDSRAHMREHGGKLTEADAVAIRGAYAQGDRLQREIAVDYGISPSMVSMIVGGKRWNPNGCGIRRRQSTR